jgi:hypothetical protein
VGSYLTDDSGHFAPEAGSLAVDAVAVSGCADVLARKASANDISNASARSTVKGEHVIPNGEMREGSVVLSCHKHGLCIGLELDCADASVSEKLSGENAATSARENM